MNKPTPPPVPPEQRLKVACRQSTCAYFHPIEGPEASTYCECSHTQKPFHMHQKPCPLFRMNWVQANAPGADKAREIIRARRKY